LAKDNDRSLELDVASKTDIGRVRADNEDSLLVLDLTETALGPRGLLKLVAVADGLGGHAGGGTASMMAISCLRDRFVGPPAARLASGTSPKVLLKETFQEANRIVHEAGAPPGDFRGMGTTLVAALVETGEVTICNVGDSRAYILDGKSEFKQITEDHSWEAEYARSFPGDQPEMAGATNLLTRALGPQRDVDVDEFVSPFRPGDTLFLCSDGLSRMVSDEKIKEILQDASSMRHAVEELVSEANKQGGEDNITVVALRALRYTT
jgi:serine/threonine protein phosphatase PrpC